MAYRRITLRKLVVDLDPDWVKDSRRMEEYRFSNGRKFVADYTKRGAYAPEE